MRKQETIEREYKKLTTSKYRSLHVEKTAVIMWVLGVAPSIGICQRLERDACKELKAEGKLKY